MWLKCAHLSVVILLVCLSGRCLSYFLSDISTAKDDAEEKSLNTTTSEPISTFTPTTSASTKRSVLWARRATSKLDDFSSRELPRPEVYTCGQEATSGQRAINFVNPSYPEEDELGGECRFRIFLNDPRVCQLRVDFVDTEMLPPTRGRCVNQQLKLEGPVWPMGLPPLCGSNTEQHFYIHLELSRNNSNFLDFVVSTHVEDHPYKFGLWITQVECHVGDIMEAPGGCTQYHVETEGTILSFNFRGRNYLNDMSYRICVRSTPGACRIRFEAMDGEFGLEKTKTTKTNGQNKSGAGPVICAGDFLRIPSGSMDGTSKGSYDRFCGSTLSPRSGEIQSRPVYSAINSNLVWLEVVTNSQPRYNSKTHGPGFRLSFSQLKICPTQMIKSATLVVGRSDESFPGIFKNSLWDYLVGEDEDPAEYEEYDSKELAAKDAVSASEESDSDSEEDSGSL